MSAISFNNDLIDGASGGLCGMWPPEGWVLLKADALMVLYAACSRTGAMIDGISSGGLGGI